MISFGSEKKMFLRLKVIPLLSYIKLMYGKHNYFSEKKAFLKCTIEYFFILF